ncbi:hypothetical protein CTP45_25495 [Salmonella enterica]|nr:hypothetical protein [Salmonella enterica]ECA8471451.1 hypothetical protein [Salmonella enterica subsp. enterica serovar Saintpaul]EDR7170626.1 hypothetical protein [Salmonella enterica subsp. houtenae]EDW0018577.1 hypothetical protein [Salmonella enterica subsp. enterica serovar Aba]HCZ4731839.1 hypothetical protein [Salmonella enterica subsp. enterica serovar Saintpaul str. CFSAN004137]
MVMKLVRKKNTRGDLIRWLTHEEDTAVKNISGLRDLTSRPQHSLATQVLREMRQLDAWLQCGCVPGDSPAMNSAKLSKDTGKLYLSGFNHEHAADCPMYRPFSADGGATSSGSRKRAGSRRINYRNFLPPDDEQATIRMPGRPEPQGDDRTCRTRRPRIARLLLSLIEDAGLNQLATLWPLPSRSIRDSLNELQIVTQSQAFIRGRWLSEIVRFQPGMGAYGQEQLMKELERPDTHWPAGRTRMFFQIFTSEHVSRDKVEFNWSGGARVFSPERGVSINGESLEGGRPPYWVILSFRRADDGKIICSEGYAHALFQKECPVPVDSELERGTLKSLSTVTKWLLNKPDAPTLSLEKPLFDIEVCTDGEKGYVLPDFIVMATTNDGKKSKVVIETMGYTDDDYCERKAEQHKGMRQIGILQTDPPRWPQEIKTSFERHLFGVLYNINK